MPKEVLKIVFLVLILASFVFNAIFLLPMLRGPPKDSEFSNEPTASNGQIRVFEFQNYNGTSKWPPIPKIFHQTFANESITSHYKDYVTRCLRLNEDWEYFLWRDADMDVFVRDHFRWFLERFRALKANIQRADAIRYMVLYHYGGIYLDMDVDCLQPFFPILRGASPAFLDQERREQARILYGRETSAMNSAMGAVPRHPFFLAMLEAILAVPRNVDRADVSTGPTMLTKVYFKWTRSDRQWMMPVALLQPEVLSPMVDDGAHKYVQLCRTFVANPSLSEASTEKRRWILEGCKSVLSPGWRVDATNAKLTVGKHWFTHLGYHSGRRKEHFDIRNVRPDIHVYAMDRMNPKK